MRNYALTFTLLLTSLTACDAPDDVGEADDRVTSPDAEEPTTGNMWGPCDFGRIDEPNWWGCNGSPGYGLACLRPVSDEKLNICAPQTWDPDVDDDCGDVMAPFGLGVRLQGSAYCVPDCVTDADCGPGRACSPQSHFCAWVGE